MSEEDVSVLSTKKQQEALLRERRKARLAQTAAQREESITGIKRAPEPQPASPEQGDDASANATEGSQQMPLDDNMQELFNQFSAMQNLFGRRQEPPRPKRERFSSKWWISEVIKKLTLLFFLGSLAYAAYYCSRPNAKYGAMITTDSGSFWWTRRIACVEYSQENAPLTLKAKDYFVAGSEVTPYPLRYKVMDVNPETKELSVVPLYAEMCLPPFQKEPSFPVAKVIFSLPIVFAFSLILAFIKYLIRLAKIE